MSLYIVTEKETREWHVGQNTTGIRDNAPNVIEVQADGHELEFIIGNYKNIVFPIHQRVVTFFGDTAKMIASNL